MLADGRLACTPRQYHAAHPDECFVCRRAFRQDITCTHEETGARTCSPMAGQALAAVPAGNRHDKGVGRTLRQLVSAKVALVAVCRRCKHRRVLFPANYVAQFGEDCLVIPRLDSDLCVWVFDILSLRGQDVRPLPFVTRRDRLDRVMRSCGSPLIQYSEFFSDTIRFRSISIASGTCVRTDRLHRIPPTLPLGWRREAPRFRRARARAFGRASCLLTARRLSA
jgi:hypothetical protein